ncbi:MAG: 3-hydroxyacyl-ACP dehydratase FabZ [Alphaproteobacteria bacterium]|nr:3-hydroxyacyl-ACP dehydratase FabZ [Alphaproteobacteria bacterium]
MNEAVVTAEMDTADIRRVMELIPHRPPFLMIDRVVDMKPGHSARGLKSVSINEPHFQGHFPGFPIMPGVLIIEALAQTAGALVVHTLGKEAEGKLVFFMTIDRARFRHPVMPGDQLELPVTVARHRGPVWRFTGEARVAGALCAEAEYSAMIVERDGQTKAVEAANG